MAVKTTAAAGNWSAGSTWVGGVKPAPGDTVSQGHDLTIDESVDIGASGANGTFAIDQTAARTITVNDGCTLRLRGCYRYIGTYGSATNALNMLAGSTLIFDSSAAADPTNTKYYTTPSAGGNAAHISIAGTQAKPCIVRSQAGGGNGYFSRGGFGGHGKFTASWTQFDDIGDSTNSVWNVSFGDGGYSPRQAVDISDCLYYDCGAVVTYANGPGANATTVRIVRVTTRGTLGSTTLNTPSGGTGTRDITGSVFDKVVSLAGDVAWTWDDVILFEGWSSGARSVISVTPTSPPLISKSTQPALDPISDLSGFYYYDRWVGVNPHMLTSIGRINRSYTIEDGVFDAPGSTGSGDALSSINTAGVQTHTVQRNILLPTSSNTSPGKFISGGGANVNWNVYHNTYIASQTDIENGCSWGELAGAHADMYANVKSNLAWHPTANRALVISRLTGTLQDGAAPANVSHNGKWNPYAGSDGDGYHSYSTGDAFTSPPGANDVTVSADPFVDRTRNIATWDASLGGLGSGTNALTELAKKNDWSGYNPAYTISALLTWVRDGFKVTDGALVNAGHDSVTIGAMEFAGSPVVVSPGVGQLVFTGFAPSITATISGNSVNPQIIRRRRLAGLRMANEYANIKLPFSIPGDDIT